jgi:hypothetical protein
MAYCVQRSAFSVTKHAERTTKQRFYGLTAVPSLLRTGLQ